MNNIDTAVHSAGPATPGGAVVLRFLIRIFRAHYKLLGAGFIVGVVLGFPLAHLMSQTYAATMTVTAARYSQGNTAGASQVASSLFSQIGGKTSELSDYSLYLRMLTSTDVSARLFKDHPALVHQLFKSEWYGDHWAPPHTLFFAVKRFAFGLLGIVPWEPPSPSRLADVLTGLVKIDTDLRDPVSVITVRSGDRQMALETLTDVHAEAEAAMKDSAEATSEISAEYLADLLEKTSTVSITDVVAENQIRDQIAAALSKSPVPFGAEFISPPDAPLSPDNKLRELMPLLIGAAGFFAVFGFLAWRELCRGGYQVVGFSLNDEMTPSQTVWRQATRSLE